MEQRYNGPGKKNDVSTNKNCKTKLKSKIPTGQEMNKEIKFKDKLEHKRRTETKKSRQNKKQPAGVRT
jgi:hypothetical protein